MSDATQDESSPSEAGTESPRPPKKLSKRARITLGIAAIVLLVVGVTVAP
jgi:hypothetical protein